MFQSPQKAKEGYKFCYKSAKTYPVFGFFFIISKVKLTDGIKINFSYEVVWRESGILFHDRYDKYLDPSFFQHRIHWFSIFNSFMMVIFLVGLVSMILMRTLRKDYARYSKVNHAFFIDS